MDPALLAPIEALIAGGDLSGARKMLQRVLVTGTRRGDLHALTALVPLAERYAARAAGPDQAWVQQFRYTLHQNILFVRGLPPQPPMVWTPQDVTGRQGDWYLIAATATAGVALVAALIAGVMFLLYRFWRVTRGCPPGWHPRGYGHGLHFYACGPRFNLGDLHRVAKDTAAGAAGLAIVAASLFVTGMLRRKG